MRKFRNINLIFFFVVLTVSLTAVVVYAWEAFLMKPLYSYVNSRYPGPENVDHRWRVAQRVEHFFISITVDIIVVTLLLRLVDRQQQALRASEARYRDLFEHASDGIAVVSSKDHCLVDVNKKFAETLGYPAQSLVGKRLCELIQKNNRDADPGAASNLFDCVGKGGKSSDLRAWTGEREFSMLTSLGASVPLLASCSDVSIADEELFILIIRDQTENKRLEREKDEMRRQLFQSSKLASIGELSAGVAHEINNPLNCIVNFAQLLRDDEVARDEMHRQMIDGIISEGERIARIVRDLLTFARQDLRLLTLVAILDVIHNSMSLFGHQLEKDGIEVEINIAEDILPVLADGSRLRQVVINLISNAHQSLKAKSARSKLFRITAHNAQQAGRRFVRVEFFDNGVGIPAGNMEKIFDPFFTTRRDSGGTGLGLSLSFGIIQDYGGTITVESAPGEYARFIVDLPAAEKLEAEYAQNFIGG